MNFKHNYKQNINNRLMDTKHERILKSFSSSMNNELIKKNEDIVTLGLSVLFLEKDDNDDIVTQSSVI